jgi:ribosomal protein L44E
MLFFHGETTRNERNKLLLTQAKQWTLQHRRGERANRAHGHKIPSPVPTNQKKKKKKKLLLIYTYSCDFKYQIELRILCRFIFT